ncbi:MAG: hypothetical protein HYV59_02415 [Planctomycetes bacterium]|nr:hypothetical protein [Planctomycetota bacterium]
MPENQNIINNTNADKRERLPIYDMSVILITPDNIDTIYTTIQALKRQTARDRLELVIICPLNKDLRLANSDVEGFAGYQILEMGEITSTAVAREAGIHTAKAPVIVFPEDHCFPASTWAEELIKRHREPWTGVGPVVCNANPATAVSWANFLLEYGEWIAFKSSGTIHHIPGHNGSYKRDALLEYGERLADMLEASSPMQWEMANRGHSFYIEANAKAYHLNFSKIFDSLLHRFYAGRLFAYRRSQDWSMCKRLLYFVGYPLIPLVRLVRILRTVCQIKKKCLIPKMLPILIILLIFDGVGEMMGYITGKAGRAVRVISDREFHHERFLVDEDRKLISNIDRLISQTR